MLLEVLSMPARVELSLLRGRLFVIPVFLGHIFPVAVVFKFPKVSSVVSFFVCIS